MNGNVVFFPRVKEVTIHDNEDIHSTISTCVDIDKEEKRTNRGTPISLVQFLSKRNGRRIRETELMMEPYTAIAQRLYGNVYIYIVRHK